MQTPGHPGLGPIGLSVLQNLDLVMWVLVRNVFLFWGTLMPRRPRQQYPRPVSTDTLAPEA